MQIIKLSAIDSTNSYLKNLLTENNLEDLTVVVAEKQLKGRGQMGTTWVAEDGKNLTFSVLKRFGGFVVRHQFRINMIISLAVYDVLKAVGVPDLKVKWPNDILSGSKKICGILIENILSGSSIQSSVIGIGLNVNQQNFGSLPNVSSLKLLLGTSFNLEELLQLLIQQLEKRFKTYNDKTFAILQEEYETHLFRRKKPSTFENPEGELFMGFIKGVSPEGKLEVILEDQVVATYGLKEIKLLY